jgi:hypothetical protein
MNVPGSCGQNKSVMNEETYSTTRDCVVQPNFDSVVHVSERGAFYFSRPKHEDGEDREPGRREKGHDAFVVVIEGRDMGDEMQSTDGHSEGKDKVNVANRFVAVANRCD